MRCSTYLPTSVYGTCMPSTPKGRLRSLNHLKILWWEFSNTILYFFWRFLILLTEYFMYFFLEFFLFFFLILHINLFNSTKMLKICDHRIDFFFKILIWRNWLLWEEFSLILPERLFYMWTPFSMINLNIVDDGRRNIFQ